MNDDQPIIRRFRKDGPNYPLTGVQSAVRQEDFKHVFSPPPTFAEVCQMILAAMYEGAELPEGVTLHERPFRAISPLNQ